MTYVGSPNPHIDLVSVDWVFFRYKIVRVSKRSDLIRSRKMETLVNTFNGAEGII